MLKYLAIVSGVFVYAASNSYLSGGLGPAGREIGLSEIQVGVILGIGALAVVPTAPFWGILSERTGGRALILLAIPVTLCGPLAIGLVFADLFSLSVGTLFWVLIVARTVKGVFGGALLPSTQALIADVTEQSTRVSGMSVMGASIGFGALTGSAMLWVTAGIGFEFGFAILVLLGAFAFLASAMCLPKKHVSPTTDRFGKVPFATIWRYFLITFAGFAAYTMVVPILGLKLMDDGQISSSQAIGSAGIILTAGTVALTATQAAIATRADWTPHFLLAVGGLGSLCGLLGLVFSTSVPVLAVWMFVLGGSLGAVAPGTLGAMSLAAAASVQGKVAGINTAFRGLGIAAGPIFGTTLYGYNTNAPLYGASILVLVIIGLSLSGFSVVRRH